MVGSYWRGSGNEKNSRLGYLLFLEIDYSLLPSMFGGRARGRELVNKPGISKQQREFANKQEISKQTCDFANKTGDLPITARNYQ